MKNFWRVFRALRVLLFVAILGLSLAINVGMFVGGALYSAASAAVETATGFRTVASRHAAEVADLTDDLNAERRVNRELRSEAGDLSDNLVNEQRVSRQLRGELADVSDELVEERLLARNLRSELVGTSDDLVNERAINRRIRGQADNLAEDLANERMLTRQLRGSAGDAVDDIVLYRGRRVAVSEAVGETADLISDRARRSASREMGSMAGEALPWIGTAVIVGVTTMEIRDLCNTLRDMNELKRAFDPTLEPGEDQKTVCAMKVPTRQEVWEAARSSPGVAWEKAKSVTPTLDDIKDIDVTEINWVGYQASISAGLKGAYEASGNALGGAMDATVEGATGIWDWFTEDGLEADAGE